MKKRILLITDYNDLYRQDIYRSQGIQLKVFVQTLEQAGFSVKQINYQTLINHTDITEWKDWYVVYTSSENIEYKEYIKDIIYALSQNNILVPRFDLLMCHEDKLFEEIMKKQVGVHSLDAKLYATLKDLKKDLQDVTYPVILKESVGSGSISVYKADNQKELLSCAKNDAEQGLLYLLSQGPL